MYRLSLSVPWLPSSMNRELRANRHARNRKNKAWDIYIANLAHGKIPPSPLWRAQVTLVRHSYRMLDFDGLVGSLKPVVDALVTTRILKDDSWTVLGAWTARQEFRPKKDGPLLEILVEGFEPPKVDSEHLGPYPEGRGAQ